MEAVAIAAFGVAALSLGVATAALVQMRRHLRPVRHSNTRPVEALHVGSMFLMDDMPELEPETTFTVDDLAAERTERKES